MRNTNKYPITVEECQEALEYALNHWNSLQLLGDTRPMCTQYVSEFITANLGQFSEFIDKKGKK